MRWNFKQTRDNVVDFPGKVDRKHNEALERILSIPRPPRLPDSEYMAALARKEVRRIIRESRERD